jgi:hypothetical protein
MQTKDEPYVRSQLEQNVLNNLDVILTALKIEYNQAAGRFFFPCPVHGSDNYNSMSIYQESGQAVCFTRNCMSNNGDGYGIFRFVSAVLKCTNKEARTFCQEVLNGKIKDINRVIVPVSDFSKKRPEIKIPKSELPQSSEIPYLLRRGYTSEIIKKYGCFIGQNKYDLMYGRATYPIFDDSYEFCVGFVGRSLYPECLVCGKYHSFLKGCPTCPFEWIKSEKWVNSPGLSRNSLLFNYWFAKEEIKKREEILLVESQHCVLRLEEAGVHNSCGIFGIYLGRKQLEKMKESGAKRVIVGLNGGDDKAGPIASEKLVSQIKDIGLEAVSLTLHKKDFGEMSVGEIREMYSFLL